MWCRKQGSYGSGTDERQLISSETHTWEPVHNLLTFSGLITHLLSFNWFSVSVRPCSLLFKASKCSCRSKGRSYQASYIMISNYIFIYIYELWYENPYGSHHILRHRLYGWDFTNGIPYTYILVCLVCANRQTEEISCTRNRYPLLFQYSVNVSLSIPRTVHTHINIIGTQIVCISPHIAIWL